MRAPRWPAFLMSADQPTGRMKPRVDLAHAVLSDAGCGGERELLFALKQMAKGLQGVIQEAALGEAWRDLQDAVDHQ